MGCSIYLKHNQTCGTIPDLFGNFQISLPEGKYNLVTSLISYIADTTENLVIINGKITECLIQLEPAKLTYLVMEATTTGGCKGSYSTLHIPDSAWPHSLVLVDSLTIKDSLSIERKRPSLRSDTVHLYPNPTQSHTTLRLEPDKPQEVFIQVMDAQGNLVHDIGTVKYRNSPVELRISTLNLAPGTYLTHITSHTSSRIIRLIVL